MQLSLIFIRIYSGYLFSLSYVSQYLVIFTYHLSFYNAALLVTFLFSLCSFEMADSIGRSIWSNRNRQQGG